MLKQALDIIKAFEGLRLTAYKDIVGVLTIGYGHTGKDVLPNMSITIEQANELLEKDVETVINQIVKVLKVDLNDNQMAAIISFTYNLGIGNLSSSTMLKMINKGMFKEASNQFIRWNKAGGKVVRGLTLRRLSEQKLFDKEIV